MGDMYAWASPDVVSRMTIPQLMLYLKRDKGECAPSNAFKNRAELEAYCTKVQAEKGLTDGL